MDTKPEKTSSEVSAERVQMHIRCRFNPIRGLTPELLATRLDEWAYGYLSQMAQLMETIEERDDVIKGVAGKRKRAASRHSWEIKVADESREAKRQKEALEYLFNNLTVTHALDQDQRGGVKLLIRQMMDAVGKKYAVHEIIWRPGGEAPHPSPLPGGEGTRQLASQSRGLSAELKFVPLWFFEGTVGKLRYLPHEGAAYGNDLEPGGWMVTVMDGLMVACSIAYMFKRLPLQDWLNYCDKFGLPGILGKTDAPKDSPEWDNMVEMVGNWGNDLAAVISRSSEVDVVEVGKAANIPFEPLIERIDRRVAALWRGGDLGTMSRDNQAVGSDPQEIETQILEEDDCDTIAETIQANIAEPALRYLFGADVEIKAWFELMPDPKAGAIKLQGFKREVWKNFQSDGTVGDMLANATDLKQLTEDVGLPAEEDYQEPWIPVKDDTGAPITGEVLRDSEGDIVGGVAAKQDFPAKSSQTAISEEAKGEGLENEVNQEPGTTNQELLAAIAMDLQPWRERLAAILQITDPTIMEARLRALLGEIEQLKRDIGADPAMAREIEGIIAGGLVKGISREAREKREIISTTN